MSTDGLVIERTAGHVGWLIVRNPERMNAMRFDMWEQLPASIQELDADEDVRVIVLRGAGDQAFVAGADISEFEKLRSDASTGAAYEAVAERAFDAILDVKKPVIAMIRGACVGGGMAMAAVADIRLASANSRFALPAARLGIGYHASGVRRLVQLLGPGTAAEVFFAALQYSADDALRMGFITRILPPDDIVGFTEAYARALAKNAPLTIRAAKAAIRRTLDPAAISADDVAELVSTCMESTDYREGVRAFLEKRPAKFTGA